MQKYTYIRWIHTDAIMIKTPDDKVARTNDARRKKDEGRLRYKIFYLSSLFVRFRKGLLKVCVWEVAGDQTLLKYFDPEVVAVSVVSFSFSMVAQPDPGVNSSVCWLSLLHASTSVFHCTACPPSRLSPTVLNSSALYYLQTPTQ